MTSLPDKLDPRIAYLVMLNGMEESSLHATLAEIIAHSFLSESETLAAAQSALRYLTSCGWLAVMKRQADRAQALSGAELEAVLSSPASWAPPASDEAPAIVLEPTEPGIAAWDSGFTILGLSEQTRSALMFSEAGGRVQLVRSAAPINPLDDSHDENHTPLIEYFSAPFPKAGGFSAYRFPGVLVHLPVALFFLLLGASLTLREPTMWPLLAVYLLAGLYVGRDLAILAHYNPLITLAVIGGSIWLIALPDKLRFLLSGSDNPVLSIAVTLAVAAGFFVWVRWRTRH